ncbi:MAG: glycosyltransferase family 4 protein [Magnetovibrionaceae bacterium]
MTTPDRTSRPDEPPQKPKLVFLVTEDWYFVSHRLGLAKAARDMGLDVVVVTRTKDHADLIQREGFQLISFLLPRSRLSVISEIKSIVNLYRVYKQLSPDIVHHVALKPSLYGSIAAFAARVPHVVNAMTGLGFVFTEGNWKRKLLQPLVRLLGGVVFSRKDNRIIIQNPDDAETLLKAGIGKRETMTLIRGSGVSFDQFQPLPEPDGIVTIAMVSRMLWNKGVGELAEASRILKAKGLRYRILLIGNPDPENPTSIDPVQLCRWHDEGLVQWRGFRDDVADVWRTSHIAVLPSYREGLPKSLLEAAACARPIVAFNVPGCREIVEDNKNGYLVPLQDHVGLATALETLITSPDLRFKMGAYSRKLVEDHFHEDIVIRETLKIYRSMLGGQDNTLTARKPITEPAQSETG